MDLQFAHIADIDLADTQRAEVAALMFDALPEFYGAMPCSMDVTLSLIAGQFEMPGTECHAPLVAQLDDKVVGAAAVYPTADASARQHESIMYLMRNLDRPDQKGFRKALTSNRAKMASLGGHDGHYIARIAVTAASRGLGIGAQLLGVIADFAQGQELVLHVDRDNVRAIEFYQRQGFIFTDDTEANKLAMVRFGPDQA